MVFNNHLFFILFFITVLIETNRVPFDLPEPESELVAGFITEYSSVYYSIIILTEYANIIALSLFILINNSLTVEILLFILYITSLIRSTLVRLKFDELMNNI
jgi:NADH:ubiquinone oxidoreductase subunit H